MTDMHTATVPADQLIRVSTNAMLFASKDDTLPSLTTVHFRPGPEDGELMLEATNRYVCSQETVELTDLEHHTDHQEHDRRCPVQATDLDVLIDAKDLAKLVKTLKLVIDPDTRRALPYDRPHVVIEHAEDAVKVQFTLIQNLGQDVTIALNRVTTGEFPKIDRLMENYLKPAEQLDAELRAAAAAAAERPGCTPRPVADVWERSYTFNQQYLSLFTKVDAGDRDFSHVQFQFTASAKPALVCIGERFRAMIVPIQKAG